MEDKSPLQKPFHVVTSDRRSFAAGFDTEDEARRDAVERSQRAVEMGLAVRYDVQSKDQPRDLDS